MRSKMAVVALALVVCVPLAAFAAKGKKANKKRAGKSPVIVATVDSISDTQLVVHQKAKKTGTATVTLKLTDQTVYRNLAVGADTDVAAGSLVAIVGASSGDKATAKAIASYKPADGEDPAKSKLALDTVAGGIKSTVRVNKGEKSDLLSGTVVSTGPLVVKVESFAGEQQVTVTPDPDVKYYKVSDLARADLQPGNQVAVYTDASGADAATATAVVQVPAAKHGKKPGKGKKGQATAAPVQ